MHRLIRWMLVATTVIGGALAPTAAHAESELTVEELSAPPAISFVVVPADPADVGPDRETKAFPCEAAAAPPRDEKQPPPSDGSRDKLHGLVTSQCAEAKVLQYVSSKIVYLTPGSTNYETRCASPNTQVFDSKLPVTSDCVTSSYGLPAGTYFTTGRAIYRFPYDLNTTVGLPAGCNYGSNRTVGCYTKSRGVSMGGAHLT